MEESSLLSMQSLNSLSSSDNSDSVKYRFWGILKGTFTAESPDCCEGNFTTSDGVEFAAKLKGGLKKRLERSSQPLAPEQADEFIYWLVYPKIVDGTLRFTLANVFKELTGVEGRFELVGILEEQGSEYAKVSIPLPYIRTVRVKGKIEAEIGQSVKIRGHRLGSEIVVQDSCRILQKTYRTGTKHEVLSPLGHTSLTTTLFTAIVCLKGQYTPDVDDPTKGRLTMEDGVTFCVLAPKLKIIDQLTKNYGAIKPGEPFPNQSIPWICHPSTSLDGSSQIALVKAKPDNYFLEADRLEVNGTLVETFNGGFILRVYRNLGRVPLSRLAEMFNELKFRYQQEQEEKLKLGYTYHILAHREGADFIVDRIDPSHIRYVRQVKNSIASRIGLIPLSPPVSSALQTVETTIMSTAETTTDLPVLPMQEPQIESPLSAEVIPMELPPAADQAEPPTIQERRKKKQKEPRITAAILTLPEPIPVKSPTKPKFVVFADGKQFAGQTSVSLKTGMLFIDGKRILQSKMVVVLGEPEQISADGKVLKTGNRATLSSR